MNTEMQRHLFSPLVRGLFVCMLGYSGFTAAAAVTEVDSNDLAQPNNAYSVPQLIAVPSEGLTISAVIGGIGDADTMDVDFFAFDATEGDTPSIEIVGAMKPDATGDCLGIGSNIALFDPSGNVVGRSSSFCTTKKEALIDNMTLSATGKYTIAVSSGTHTFLADGEVENADLPTAEVGDYQLVIGRVRNPTSTPPSTPPPPPAQSPSAIHVPIEVRHWRQDESDLGRRRGMWPITVAILGMKDFDTTTVDLKSLKFGKTGEEQSLFRCRKHGKDINRDGRLDAVCYFKPDIANFQTDDLNGELRGKTKSGQSITGSAALKIYSKHNYRHGFKRHHHHGGDKRAANWPAKPQRQR